MAYQISNCKAKCDVRVDFLECGGENNVENRPTYFFFGSDTSGRPFCGPRFWLEKFIRPRPIWSFACEGVGVWRGRGEQNDFYS